MRRLPFTLAFLLVLIVSNLAAGTLSGSLPTPSLTSWGVSHVDVRGGDLYRLLTGTFLSHDIGMFLRQVLFASLVIGAYEWVAGSLRAFFVFFSIDIIGTLLVLFIIVPGFVMLHPGIGNEALSVHDVGMSAGGFGLLGALVARQDLRWFLLGAICIAIAIKIWISFDLIADTAHILCLFLGFGVETKLKSRVRKGGIAKQ